MGTLGTILHRINGTLEIVLAITVALVLLAGLAFLVAQKVTSLWSRLHGKFPKWHAGSRSGAMWRALLLVLAVSLLTPALAGAEGWWWGSPVNPGFDRNTVIQVNGTARHLSIAEKLSPGMLTLECDHESYTVMLAPGWYLAQVRADIRDGDALTVQGSKMMDRHGQLHLVAARVTNERTGTVLDLRDDVGRPRWMGGPRSGRMMR
jgi:hypothetical protein